MDVNPYESPKSAAEPEPSGGAGDPLVRAILGFEPWATLAGVSVMLSGAALVLTMLIGGAAGKMLMPVVVFGVGSAVLATRLLLLGRAVRSAAATAPVRLDLCIRQLRAVFSYTGLLGAIYVGFVLLLLMALVVFLR